MNRTYPIPRFRTNPVEIIIFLTITLIFIYSLYNLLYGRVDFQLNTISTMSANPISEGRSPASTVSSLTTYEMACEKMSAKTISSNKLRLHGLLCSSNSNKSDKILNRAEIINTTNQFAATVFTDIENGQFSTDYIPLSAGLNSLHVLFTYQDGEKFELDLAITQSG